MNHLGQRNIPAKRAPFYYIEELVLYSFNVRIVVLLNTNIRTRGGPILSTNIKPYLLHMPLSQLTADINEIRTILLGPDAAYLANLASCS